MRRLSAALYNEISEWASEYYIGSGVNPFYRPKFKPSLPSFKRCPSCSAYSKLGKEKSELTFWDYIAKIRKLEDDKDLKKNKCPKCGKYDLKTSQTRWGNMRICSNYPKCDFTESFENNSP